MPLTAKNPETQEYRYVRVPITLEREIREKFPEFSHLNSGALVQVCLAIIAGGAIAELVRSLNGQD